MRKFVSATLAAMLFSSSAFAAGTEFYNVDVRPGPYYVKGVTADTNGGSGNPACYAEVNYRDGSRFQLIRDLADGELYIYLRNTSWNISDAPGVYQLRANFSRNGQFVSGLNFSYNQVNKDTIVIRNIKRETFLPLFTANAVMTFVMPGNIQNASVDLTGSSRSLEEISKCIDAARSVDLYPQGQPAVSAPRTFNNI
jgi:opacity protein-like surface antigen